MKLSNNYLGGWLDSSIRNFLYTIEPPSASMRYALVTCLDSSTDIKHMIKKSSALKPLEKEGKIVGKSLLIETKKLLDAERNRRIFFGFDEIWFSSAPALIPKPPDFWLNVPAELVRQMPNTLIRWMRNGNYSLGLGDGTGLNYVAKVRSVVARSIINAYNEIEEKEAA
jgi:hypothetical protein